MSKINPKKRSVKKSKNTDVNNTVNYVDYIKGNKYKIFNFGLGALMSSAGAYYLLNKFSDKTVKKAKKTASDIINETMKKEEFNKFVANAIKLTLDAYIDNIYNSINAKLSRKINLFDAVQDAIASVAVPKEIKKYKSLDIKIHNVIKDNIQGELDPDTISKIELYLIDHSIIEENCSTYNNKNIPGSFPCDEKKKSIAKDKVLKYYFDKTLLSKVNKYLEDILLKSVEEYLVKSKVIDKNCTKNFKSIITSVIYPCLDQEKANKIINDTFLDVKNKKIKLPVTT